MVWYDTNIRKCYLRNIAHSSTHLCRGELFPKIVKLQLACLQMSMKLANYSIIYSCGHV